MFIITIDKIASAILYCTYVHNIEGEPMPRPKKCRCIENQPIHQFYKPQGVPIQELKGVTLPVEGLEAMRLADAEGLDQEDAARRMGVSRPTFSRILADARRQVARALSSGWAIRIEGGAYEVAASASPEAVCGGLRCSEKMVMRGLLDDLEYGQKTENNS